MRVLDGKPTVSRSDLDIILKDLVMVKVLRRTIEGLKDLYPDKFKKAGKTLDFYEKGNVIDFQYARLFYALENDPRFREYCLALLQDEDYREMQIDEFFTVMKPMSRAG
jgi:hypothetical protein